MKQTNHFDYVEDRGDHKKTTTNELVKKKKKEKEKQAYPQGHYHIPLKQSSLKKKASHYSYFLNCPIF